MRFLLYGWDFVVVLDGGELGSTAEAHKSVAGPPPIHTDCTDQGTSGHSGKVALRDGHINSKSAKTDQESAPSRGMSVACESADSQTHGLCSDSVSEEVCQSECGSQKPSQAGVKRGKRGSPQHRKGGKGEGGRKHGVQRKRLTLLQRVSHVSTMLTLITPYLSILHNHLDDFCLVCK